MCQWPKNKNTRGVGPLVYFAAEERRPVPSKIMKQLFERCNVTGVSQQSAKLATGDNARIYQGPSWSTIGEIISIEPNQRIHFLPDFMGQKLMHNVAPIFQSL